jgi:hypothetical protein
LIRQLTGHQCLFECSAHNLAAIRRQTEAYRSVHDGDLDPRRLSAVRVARRARDRRSKSHGEMRDVRWVTGS